MSTVSWAAVPQQLPQLPQQLMQQMAQLPQQQMSQQLPQQGPMWQVGWRSCAEASPATGTSATYATPPAQDGDMGCQVGQLQQVMMQVPMQFFASQHPGPYSGFDGQACLVPVIGPLPAFQNLAGAAVQGDPLWVPPTLDPVELSRQLAGAVPDYYDD